MTTETTPQIGPLKIIGEGEIWTGNGDPGTDDLVAEVFDADYVGVIAAAPELLAALEPVAEACRHELCRTDPSSEVLDATLTADGALTVFASGTAGVASFRIRISLAQANAIADALGKARNLKTQTR